jgi:hypothetical protein
MAPHPARWWHHQGTARPIGKVDARSARRFPVARLAGRPPAGAGGARR